MIYIADDEDGDGFTIEDLSATPKKDLSETSQNKDDVDKALYEGIKRLKSLMKDVLCGVDDDCFTLSYTRAGIQVKLHCNEDNHWCIKAFGSSIVTCSSEKYLNERIVDEELQYTIDNIIPNIIENETSHMLDIEIDFYQDILDSIYNNPFLQVSRSDDKVYIRKGNMLIFTFPYGVYIQDKDKSPIPVKITFPPVHTCFIHKAFDKARHLFGGKRIVDTPDEYMNKWFRGGF